MTDSLLILAAAATALALIRALRSRWTVRHKMGALAEDLRAEFNFRDRDSLADRFGELAIWRFGHARRIHHVLRGQSGNVNYWCFADRFDVGFGRDRVQREYVGFVAQIDCRQPGLVCVREGDFIPSGPYANYRLMERTGRPQADDSKAAAWRVWLEPGDDPNRTWGRIAPVCANISESGLIEVREKTVLLWVPRRGSPEDFRWTVETGLMLSRALQSNDHPSAA